MWASCNAARAYWTPPFAYERKIDARTYERQRDDLRQAITLATLELEDSRAADVDVEALLRFSERVLCNAAALWQDAPLDQRQRLQAALFPEGLRMRDGGFGTVVTSLAFKYFGGNQGSNSALASPTGFAAGWQLPVEGFSELAA